MFISIRVTHYIKSLLGTGLPRLEESTGSWFAGMTFAGLPTTVIDSFVVPEIRYGSERDFILPKLYRQT